MCYCLIVCIGVCYRLKHISNQFTFSRVTLQGLKKVAAIFLLLFFAAAVDAQELFQQTEPASNVPKNTLGIRAFGESYNEVGKLRNIFALRAMYGLTPKLTVMLTANMSNHHNKDLPPDFPVHNTPQIGIYHPYLFNGVDAYAKYRFLTIDGEHSHIRMAVYGEYSYLNVAHDEAEPTLLDDTRGYGGGLIATYLKNHLAVSFTGGFVVPTDYKGDVADAIAGLPTVPAVVKYGKGAVYDLSFGYLLFPHEYKSYEQTNWSLYLELMGKSYGGAQVYFGNIGANLPMYEISVKNTPVLHGYNYLEAWPGVQCIIKSNLRVDFSMGFPLINKSYVHYYPVYMLGLQRYFYFNKKHSRG